MTSELKSLILGRRTSEKVFIGPDIIVTVHEIRGSTVRLRIQAPASVPIHRDDIQQTQEGRV